MINYNEITKDNFGANSLDDYVRHQEVYECWRCINGEWTLVPVRFTEHWDDEKLRYLEQDILSTIEHGFAFMAQDGGKVVGFAMVDTKPIGENNEYIELTDLHISEPYRNRGIGKQLFRLVSERARETGAQKLYISAHSSKESQAAYRALGCDNAKWLYPKKVEEEPYDVQMEYVLV